MEASSQYGPGCPDSTTLQSTGSGSDSTKKISRYLLQKLNRFAKYFFCLIISRVRGESMQQSTSAHRFQEFIMANDLVGANTPELKLAWAFKM